MAGYIFLFAALLLASISDIRKRIIPDMVHVLLLLSGAIFIFGYGQPWKPRLSAFIFSIVTMLVFSLRITGLGGGDVKMIACIVFALGFMPGFCSIIVALVLAAIFASFMSNKKGAIPLAPFLFAGCVAIILIQRLIPDILLVEMI